MATASMMQEQEKSCLPKGTTAIHGPGYLLPRTSPNFCYCYYHYHLPSLHQPPTYYARTPLDIGAIAVHATQLFLLPATILVPLADIDIILGISCHTSIAPSVPPLSSSNITHHHNSSSLTATENCELLLSPPHCHHGAAAQ